MNASTFSSAARYAAESRHFCSVGALFLIAISMSFARFTSSPRIFASACVHCGVSALAAEMRQLATVSANAGIPATIALRVMASDR